MRRPATFLAALVAAAVLVPVAVAATDPARPPAGAYTMGAKSGFTVNKARTSVSGLRFVVASGPETTDDCTSATLPTGKLTLSIAKHLKIVAAHRGGYTVYIVGRSTPKTSSGITPIPETFKLSSGGTVKGTLSLTFSADHPKSGDGQIVVAGCTLYTGFRKR
jgi:hypothetical protein